MPAVNLGYSSASGNGVFGIGFSLTLPFISRRTEKRIPRYDDTDTFVLPGGVNLVAARVGDASSQWVRAKRRVQEAEDGATWTVTDYLPQLEGSFPKIEFWVRGNGAAYESYWKVVSAENITSIYGRSENARIADPRNRSRVFQWLIEESWDALGNKVAYSYKQENDENVPEEVYETGRTYGANRYIHSVKYGNYFYEDGDGGQQEAFAFEMVFDYGEYDLDNPDLPIRPWDARKDPFSSYRAGFEIRTHRLCKAVLMFHRFAGEADGQRFIVRATLFEYEQTPVISFLKSVQVVGYRQESDGSQEVQRTPPTRFAYSQFKPASQSFEPLVIHGGGEVPGYQAPSQYMLVDLYGEGIPGFLHNGEATTLYWKPAGNGEYGFPEPPVEFPIERRLDLARYSLQDLNGNGRLDLVVSYPGRGGYYKNNDDGTWEPYINFTSYPTGSPHPAEEVVDLNGDGLADILFIEDKYVNYYPSAGSGGYGPLIRKLRQHQVAATSKDYAEEFVGFAGLFGDGLNHRVRVRSGIVECWPDLGHGQFGDKVLFGNAPRFDGGLDASRLFFADLDGSGAEDLIYVDVDHVKVFVNQSGNSFGEPIAIPLPVSYQSIDQVSFGDVLGQGAASLILTIIEPEVRHLYYDFIGRTKPYLLDRLENGLGATTAVEYKASTAYYLRDKRAGRPWKTKLPFPVYVVSKVESVDHISGSKSVALYSYHDGYYDPHAKEYRGFGFVERWDTETFDLFSQPGLHRGVNFNAGRPELHTAPVYTKTWYHTGARAGSQTLSRQYGSEYFNKDAGAHELADSAFDPAIYLSGEPTILQAYAALTGRVLREEVYGLDGQPVVSENPYTVTESNYYVRLIQPAQSALEHAVFLVFDTERIAYNYERDLADPRVSHNFNLAVDAFGSVTESCTIYYPRRAPADRAADPVEKVYPEQSTLKAVAQLNLFINAVDGCRLLGVPCEGRSFEVGGLNVLAGDYFTFAEVKAAFAEALRNQVQYGQPFAPGQLQARTFSWQRTYYWNEEQTAALPLQSISPRALWHHTETAEFPPQFVEDVFGGRVGPAMLEADGNYFLSDGYWWNPGLTLFYYSRPDSFYLPRQSLSACGVVTSVDYDRYWLLPVRESELVSDDGAEPQENVTTALNDYYTLQPKRTSDINDVVAQALYDPLGFTTVTSIHKTTGGGTVGDGDLADYRRRPHPTFDEVIANPQYYLEDATTYFYYDLFAWTRDGQPACSVSLAREAHVSDLPPDTESRIRIQIVYSDGFAREIETRDNAEPGAAATPTLKRLPSDTSPDAQAASGPWVVSGQTVYNNKSLPVEEYLPRYSLSPHYEPQGQSVEQGLLPPPTRTHYDPLLRVIRVDTPKGFFTKVEITAWAVRRFDEDDTVKDSAYYREHINDDRPEFKDEREALEKAAVFYDTPEQSTFDNMGRVFLVVQTNARQLGDAVEYSLLETSSELDIQSNVLSMTDPRGVLSLTQSFSMTGGVLSTKSADAGLRLNLENADDNTVHAWDNRGIHAATSYDRLQRPSAIRVEGDDGQGLVLAQVVERIVYGESQPDSFEKNLRGQVYEWYDQAGVVRYDQYGIEGRLLKTVRQLRADYKNEANWDDPTDVALEPERYETAYAYDALGNLTSERTPDGSDYRAQYVISGALKRVEVIFPEGGSRTFVEGIEYDAAGQRQRIRYGNGVVTKLTYEDTTLRLSNIYTTRPPAERKGQSASPTLQDIAYTYDPVGNLTTTSDRSQETVFCAQQQVEPRSGYTYDAVYRLIEAAGRQHPGIGVDTHTYGFKQTLYMSLCPPNINDGDKLQNYKESYTYDASGNLIELRHVAPPSSPSWTRTLAVPADSNRGVPSDSPDTRYDANGNMLALQNLQRLAWDCRNNISQADVILREGGNSDSDYFVYDYEGNRVRKVVERIAHGGTITQIQETVYLGNLVIYRTKQLSEAGTATTLERQSLHVMDGETCVAITNYWPQDDFKRETATPGSRQFRFQLPDILGSSCVEVDQSANLISYEEYFPYGGTSVIAGDDAGEVARKDYRYSGKECDDSTGLYYYGARYYAAWMGRWLSPDPSGPTDGLNLYAFVGANPTSFFDNNGKAKQGLWGMWRTSASPRPQSQSLSGRQPQSQLFRGTENASQKRGILTTPKQVETVEREVIPNFGKWNLNLQIQKENMCVTTGTEFIRPVGKDTLLNILFVPPMVPAIKTGQPTVEQFKALLKKEPLSVTSLNVAQKGSSYITHHNVIAFSEVDLEGVPNVIIADKDDTLFDLKSLEAELGEKYEKLITPEIKEIIAKVNEHAESKKKPLHELTQEELIKLGAHKILFDFVPTEEFVKRLSAPLGEDLISVRNPKVFNAQSKSVSKWRSSVSRWWSGVSK
jgi:RHS repeat-associated protein